MKTTPRIALVLVVGLSIAALSNAQPFPADGLVAYYPFRGNANDASGHENNGMVHGATLTSDRFGHANSAYDFDGSSSYIGFRSVPMRQVDDVTISLWIKPAATSQHSTPVCLGYDDGNTGDGFALGMSADCYYPGNHFFTVFGGVAWLDTGYAFAQANAWYQLVMVRSSGTTRYYVNAIQTPNTSHDNPTTPTAFTIGSSTGVRFFHGAIADVRIYARALATSEVKELYNLEARFSSSGNQRATPAKSLGDNAALPEAFTSGQTQPYHRSVTQAKPEATVVPAVVTLGFAPTLTIKGAAGDRYLIQRSSDLSSSNNWKTVSSVTLTQPVQIWVDTNIDAASPFNNRYFYQLTPQ